VARWRQIERQKAGLPPEDPAPVAAEAESAAPGVADQATITLPPRAGQELR
jgi:UPF0755 protein